jgi:hypothetical protein
VRVRGSEATVAVESPGDESSELEHGDGGIDAAAGGLKRNWMEDERLYEGSDPLGAH